MDIQQAAQRLIALREQYRYTQTELANKAGVTRSWLAKFERGNTKRPGLQTLLLLASAFNMTPERFLDELGLLDTYRSQLVPEVDITTTRRKGVHLEQALDESTRLIIQSEELQPYLQYVAELLDELGELVETDPAFVRDTLRQAIDMIRLNARIARRRPRARNESNSAEETPTL